MEGIIGETAALAAALCYSLASTTYTLAGRKIGASVSMAVSLIFSLIFLLPIHLVLLGEVFPFSTSPERWLILAASSLAGFVISAIFLLRSFQYIGPRLAMLIGSTSPIFAALMAWILLGQELPAYAVAGIALVIGGVVWVVSQDAAETFKLKSANYSNGLLTALAAAIGMGSSYVLMSAGVSDGFHAMSAAIIRTVVGIVILWLYILLRGGLRDKLRPIITEPRALLFLLLAGLSGPVVGATLILLSLQFTSVGIASTLTSTTPILLIPISFLVFNEKITARAVVGTLVAIAGVAVLFAG